LLAAAPDMELWSSAIAGDRDAFGLLFKRHYNLLYQYGIKVCPSSEVVEDSIQELFVELWQRKPTQEITSIKAYFLQALKFKLYKTFRRQRVVINIEGHRTETFELSHETFLINEKDDEERAKQVLEAINKLPARQKEIIYLKIYKGLSYEEISVVMQLNYQVVRNLLCQSLKTFRKLVHPEE
jgi:RNA polymerase sigma factor (sigma-70 family)